MYYTLLFLPILVSPNDFLCMWFTIHLDLEAHFTHNHLVFESPQISPRIMMALVEMYKGDLEVFAHMQLPRFYMPSSFHDRADSSLVLLVRQCPYLHTLVKSLAIMMMRIWIYEDEYFEINKIVLIFSLSSYLQVVREKVSTATVLLLAHTAKNLIYFYIRRNAIILKVW